MQDLEFAKPGPGCWELETAHHFRPLTRFVSDLIPDPMARGFREGTAFYGLNFSHLQSTFVNGFWYCQQIYAGMEDSSDGTPSAELLHHPSVKERMEHCSQVFQTRAWLEDLRVWDEEIKPDSIDRNKALQSVKVKTITDSALLAHIADCADNLREMIYRHHRFTAGAMLPVGHFLTHAEQWTELDASVLMELLQGASPISRGRTRELVNLAHLLKERGIKDEFFVSSTSQDILNCLSNLDDEITAALDAYLEIVGNSIVSGYDVSAPTGFEVPGILVGAIQAAFKNMIVSYDQAGWLNKRDTIIQKVPPEYRNNFEIMLDDARKLFRLREERTVYTDQWALGLARRAILEAGARLVQCEKLSGAEDLVDATVEEISALLGGTDCVSSAELRERAEYRLHHTLSDAPTWLGEPPAPPPSIDLLPSAGRQGAVAFAMAMHQIYDVCADEGKGEKLQGIAASPGVYQGPVRLVDGMADFAELRQGDVIVTRTTSAAFSVVLPLVGAIVTDRGGRLSHPAIIAREYGIPGVVGTRIATGLFHDGDLVRVDGSAGTVEKVR